MAKITEAKAPLETEAEAEEPAPKRLGRKPRARSRVPRPKAQPKFPDPETRIIKTRDGSTQACNADAGVDAGD